MTGRPDLLATIPIDPRWPRGQPLILDGVRLRRSGTEILRGVTVRFEAAARYVLIGPSGAGKSTLLRLLNRLEDPDGGRILIGETPLNSLPVRCVRSGVGLVFQAPRPLPGSIAENLSYSYSVRGSSGPDSESMGRMLDEVGLDPKSLDRDAAGLSGGERQRLALAVALTINPEILVLDEPTSALDPASAHRIIRLLGERCSRTIAVCHHRDHARLLGDHAVVLDRGEVVDAGPVGEVLDRCDDSAWGTPE